MSCQRFLKLVMTFAFLIVALHRNADAEAKPDQTIQFTNGAQAVTYFNCGDTDLCAVVTQPNGDVLSIYSEGAALCQPYFLHFVLTSSSNRTIYEFSRAINHTVGGHFDAACGHTVATEMVLDRGYVHLLVTENPDGTLNLKFSATGK